MWIFSALLPAVEAKIKRAEGVSLKGITTNNLHHILTVNRFEMPASF